MSNAALPGRMLPARTQLVTTGVIVLSALYTGLKVPAIWHRYRGQYRRLLLGLSLASVLFGLAHVGLLVARPRAIFAVSETGAEIGVLLVIAGLGFVHPRLRHPRGDRR